MKILLSGISRQERLELALEAGAKNLILDYSLAKSLDEDQLQELRDSVEFLVLDYDLGSSWSRYKSLWFGEPTSKQLGRASSVSEAREVALDKLTAKVSQYSAFANSCGGIFDVVVIPSLPIDPDRGWAELLKSQVCMITARRLEDLEGLLATYSYVALHNDIDLQDTKAHITPLIASLRSFKCKLHRWGGVDKETALTGLFWSGSSSNWITGSKYGNTYEYVGNLKLTLHHGSKGAGKRVRSGLKAKCETLGIDHSELMSDDRRAINLWNLSQWVRYSQDSEKLSGYWSERKTETTSLVTSSTKTLATPASAVGYSRSCNSCFLSSQCPLYEPDSDCRVPTTQKVDTPDDIQTLLNKVIQIQGDRVMFSAFAERVQNAGINPEVSKELETLTKLMKDAKEITSPIGGDEVLIKAKGSGVISKLFGGYGRSGGGTKPSTSETIIDVSPLKDEA